MRRGLKYIVGAMLVIGLSFVGKVDVEAAVRIHYLGLQAATDAILLEDNGHFAMIDSGEDWDYPQGESLKYPFRSGIVTNRGFDAQVIYYLKSVGVTTENFDYYIGTHSHSDHIGTADEVIRTFHPKRIYLKKYHDSNVKSESGRWDNLYVYQCLLQTANDCGIEVIQEMTEGMTLTLGKKMRLNLYNTAVKSKVKDENANSLVIKASIYQNTVLLTGDMEPPTARELIKKGSIGKTDILKMPHHGYPQNNPEDILKVFAPKSAVVTGPLENVAAESRIVLGKIGTDVRSVCTSGAALVQEFSAAGYSTTGKRVKAGWFEWEGNRYYMGKNGRTTTDWKQIGTTWYYFDKTGKVQTGWLKKDGNQYYLKQTDSRSYKRGTMLTGWQSIGGKDFYFVKKSGKMLTGWQTIDGRTYYMKQSGVSGIKGQVMTGWQKYQDRMYYFKKTGSRGIKGVMLTGWQTIGGDYFYFSRSGYRGWSKGKLLTGLQTIDGKIYYLKQSGAAGIKGRAMKGWISLGEDSYYAEAQGGKGIRGSVLTGWQLIGGAQYYFDESGKMTDIRLTAKTADETLFEEASMRHYNQAKAQEKPIRELSLRLSPQTKEGELVSETVQRQGNGDMIAMRASLTGELEQFFDLYYRVYVTDYGWLGWTKNGELTGLASEEAAPGAISMVAIMMVPRGDRSMESDEQTLLGSPQEQDDDEEFQDLELQERDTFENFDSVDDAVWGDQEAESVTEQETEEELLTEEMEKNEILTEEDAVLTEQEVQDQVQ